LSVGKIKELTGSNEGYTMEVFYFDFFVLPLGILVGILVASVYYYANKEEIARRKTKKFIQVYIKEKLRQQKAMNKELAKIDKLLEDELIDEETCERMKSLLIVTNEEKSDETMRLLENVANNN
jgi:Na+-transporting NADH:ubiquinone oxidoreductase subunit NqrC